MSIASLSARRASATVRRGPPMPAIASRNAPAPRPSSKRPPLRTSMVAACLASITGGRSGRSATLGKKWTLLVCAASQVIWVKVSTKPGLYGWSWTPAYSRPDASAVAAMRAAIAKPFPPGGRWWALSVGRLGWVEDGFDLDEDLDAVADDHPAAVQGDVGADAEVAPVELGGGREAGPGAAVGVAGEAVDVQGQGDRPGHPVQGQLAADVEAVLAVADAGGAEGHRRVGVGLEEVGRAEVLVALGVLVS